MAAQLEPTPAATEAGAESPASGAALPPLMKAMEKAAARYRLRLPERRGLAQAGEWLGKGAGSSIEFQDRKDYTPGDDLRRIDWRAYARNDRLTVKLYREEIRPSIDLLLDDSASMAASAGKRERALAAGWLFYLLGAGLRADMRVWRLGAGIERVPDPLRLLRTEPERAARMAEGLAAAPVARRGGLTLMVSDFLFPCAPEGLAAALTRGERAVCVQVVTAFEDAPEPGGHMRLEDAETGEWRDVALDTETVGAYRRRLNAWREEFARRLRMRGGEWIVAREDESAEGLLEKLTRAGVIEA